MEKLNREELITLVEKIRNAAGSTEEENNLLLELFLNNVPDPNASNYIFELEHESLSAAKIVDKSLSYKPIQL
jgi:hypothetical protein